MRVAPPLGNYFSAICDIQTLNGPLAHQPRSRRLRQDEAIELEGQPAVVTPGMKGKVLSLHDGFHLDVTKGDPIPPKAIVQFEAVTLMVDERMRWKKVAG